MEPEDSPLIDERVIDKLVELDPDNLPGSTEELNSVLRATTGYTTLVPVFTNDPYEDIAKWLTEVESDKLVDWFFYHSYSGTVVNKALTEVFCSPSNTTYLGMRYIEHLKSAGFWGRKNGYEYIKYVATGVCGVSLEDFYSTLEGYGVVDVLCYDIDYPLEKRKYAMSLAASSVCTNSQRERVYVSGSDLLVVLMSIVYAKRMYIDAEGHIDKIIVNNRYEGKEHPTLGGITTLVLEVLRYGGSEHDLLVHFKDSVTLALGILEEVYNIDVAKIMSIQRGR